MPHQKLKKLFSHPFFQKFDTALKEKRQLLIERLWDAPKALLAAYCLEVLKQPILILTGRQQEEERLYHDLPQFSQAPLFDFPAWEALHGEGIAPSLDVVGERYQTLDAITHSQGPFVIMTTAPALLQKVVSPQTMGRQTLKLEKGKEHPFEALQIALKEMGYRQSDVASDKGEMAVRGGILDIFPTNLPSPVRIEFWDEEIESIRFYDPISQKSFEEKEQVLLTASDEMALINKEPELATLFDYLPKDTLFFFDDLLSLEDRVASLKKETELHKRLYLSTQDLLHQTQKRQTLFFSPYPAFELGGVNPLGDLLELPFYNHKITALPLSHPFKRFQGGSTLEERLDHILQEGEEKKLKLHFLCETSSEKSAFEKRIQVEEKSLPKHSKIEQGYLSSGFYLEGMDEALVPHAELSQKFKIRRKIQRNAHHTVLEEAYQIEPGDYVVHSGHGIGRFLGYVTKKNLQGIESDFLDIEYADEGRLFVPLTHSHLVSKYVGAAHEVPKLHRLGGKRWAKTKQTTQKAILNYAADLLKIYSQREHGKGFAFPKDSDEMRLFEEEFPFDETEDQLLAIDAIKKDMQEEKAMERLICGDVGYGKTEVAMRAAFKAVMDGGKQVAVLVPTTVLALQHYENFLERVENYGVRVAVISRFQKAKQVQKTLDDLAAGRVDILIGTHRILGKDVIFDNLGLIIIDEEQRFGVKVKEHLKTMKGNVDCLTLSATPIPRTLYLALTGGKDMSVINTPPHDRLPIKSLVTVKNDKLIRGAIIRELNRDGQVYYIHNRVDLVPHTAVHLQKLVPEARIGYVHGQMSADEIDQAFHKFKSGELDILVATTIVESGLDIPNANTLIVQGAHCFGLAELYQLRGRVGRWNKQAFAYFLTPSPKELTPIAKQRLEALTEIGGYGGGFKIAMRDLEIRGAGDILGLEQSGHVSSLGFHLYCRMLKKTFQALRGEKEPLLTDPKIELPLEGGIPSSYVAVQRIRMDLFRKLGEALNFNEIDDVMNELKDRFGRPPIQAINLRYLSRIRLFAAKKGVTSIKLEKVTLTLEFKGKKGEIVTKKALFKIPEKAQTLEEMVINAIKKHHPWKK